MVMNVHEDVAHLVVQEAVHHLEMRKDEAVAVTHLISSRTRAWPVTSGLGCSSAGCVSF